MFAGVFGACVCVLLGSGMLLHALNLIQNKRNTSFTSYLGLNNFFTLPNTIFTYKNPILLNFYMMEIYSRHSNNVIFIFLPITVILDLSVFGFRDQIVKRQIQII